MQLGNLSSSIHRSLTCVCLLGLVVTAYPLDTNSRNIEQYAKQYKLARFLLQRDANQQSIENLYQLRNAPGTSNKDKRYGIVGLDNVDMILSTLDRARKKPRYRPTMSMSLTYSDLRRLMDAGR